MSLFRRGIEATGKFFRRHSKTIGKAVLGAAAVAATVAHSKHQHSAREARSEQRHRDNVGNMEWYTSQPEVREALERRRRETEGQPSYMSTLLAGARSRPPEYLRGAMR